MSRPITTDDLADLAEARGKPGTAALLRWREPPPAEVAEERDDFAGELEHAEEMLADLESVLCDNCKKKWKAQQ